MNLAGIFERSTFTIPLSDVPQYFMTWFLIIVRQEFKSINTLVGGHLLEVAKKRDLHGLSLSL